MYVTVGLIFDDSSFNLWIKSSITNSLIHYLIDGIQFTLQERNPRTTRRKIRPSVTFTKIRVFPELSVRSAALLIANTLYRKVQKFVAFVISNAAGFYVNMVVIFVEVMEQQCNTLSPNCRVLKWSLKSGDSSNYSPKNPENYSNEINVDRKIHEWSITSATSNVYLVCDRW